MARATKEKEKERTVGADLVEPSNTGQEMVRVTDNGNPTPGHLLELAIRQDVDVEKLKGLMELQERWEANQAKKAFFEALANFQAEVPEIPKTKKVGYESRNGGKVSYKYAPISDIDATIKPFMAAFGLSKKFEISETSDGLQVRCKITHVLGHSEVTEMSSQFDTSGNKNAIQSRGSAVTYLQRYTLIGALGLTTADEDNDGHGDEGEQRRRPESRREERQESRREEPRRGERKAEPAQDRSVAPDRESFHHRLKEIRNDLVGLGYNAFKSDMERYARKCGFEFGTNPSFKDIPDEHLENLVDAMGRLLAREQGRTVKTSEPESEPVESQPEPKEPAKKAETKKKTDDVPLTARKRDAVPSKHQSLLTLIEHPDEGLNVHGISNSEVFEAVNAYLEENGRESVDDIAEIPKDAVQGCMRVLSGLLAQAKDSKKRK